MKMALKNLSANCFRKFKRLQLTFQVVFPHQGAGACVARRVFVHQDVPFGGQVRQHRAHLQRGIHGRAEEGGRGEALWIVQDGAHVGIAGDHPGRQERAEEDRRFVLRLGIERIRIFEVGGDQGVERERTGGYGLPRHVGRPGEASGCLSSRCVSHRVMACVGGASTARPCGQNMCAQCIRVCRGAQLVYICPRRPR